MERPRTLWDRWYRRTLPAYWVFLFCATHFPRARSVVPVREADKVAHFVAFGLLAFLLWRFGETFQRPVSARFVWIAALWVGAYAALDEYLQQYVGRNASLLDWLCDLAGIAIVLGVLEWRRRTRRLRVTSSPSRTLDSSSEKT